MLIEVKQTTTYKLDTDEYDFDSEPPTTLEITALLDDIADGNEDNPDDEATITITYKKVKE